MFHIYVHISSFCFHPTLNLILSLRNNQVHTFHSAFPSSPPILFLDRFALCICLVHQRNVSGWAGGFVVPGSLGCAEGSEPESALCFGSGKNSSTVYLVFECFCWFARIAFDAHHPSLLLNSCKWDNLVPIHITLVMVLLYRGLGFNLYRQFKNLWQSRYYW